MANHPTLEKIHDPKFYQHTYYNEELGIHVSFAKKQLEIARRNDLNLFRNINELRSSPPIFALEFPIAPQQVDTPFGSMMIRSRGLDFGCTLQPIDKRRNPLLMTYKSLYDKICCGQMFNKNGEIITFPEFSDKLEALIDNKAFTFIDLTPKFITIDPEQTSYKFADNKIKG